MDTLNSYRQIIQKALEQFVTISYVNTKARNEIVVDTLNDRYVFRMGRCSESS